MKATSNTHLRPGWNYGATELGDPCWLREVDGLRYAVWIHPVLGVRTSLLYAGWQQPLGGMPYGSPDVVKHMEFAERWHAGLMAYPRPEQPQILRAAGSHNLAAAA